MVPKEYLVDAFNLMHKAVTDASDIKDIFEFLDEEGNPFKPDEPVHYKLVDENGTVLKEGTIKDENTISIKDIPTPRKFSVIVDLYTVSSPKGFECLDKNGNKSEDMSTDENPYIIV